MPRRLLTSALATSVLCAVALLAPGLVAPASAAVPDQDQWLSDVDQGMHGSWKYLDKRIDSDDQALALNLDIDNTSLASHYSYGDPVQRVLGLTQHAQANGVAVLFNTGRVKGDGRLKQATAQLEAAGFSVTEICGRTSAKEGLAHSKKRCRQHFVDEGYLIVENIGNRRTDLAGGNYERKFRLPSYHDQLA